MRRKELIERQMNDPNICKSPISILRPGLTVPARYYASDPYAYAPPAGPYSRAGLSPYGYGEP